MEKVNPKSIDLKDVFVLQTVTEDEIVERETYVGYDDALFAFRVHADNAEDLEVPSVALYRSRIDMFGKIVPTDEPILEFQAVAIVKYDYENARVTDNSIR